MKTSTIISALSLALIITFANTGFAKNNKSGRNENPATDMKYQVRVNMEASIHLCNIYQVEIVDASGRLVAPAQTFLPGTDTYFFEEQTRQTVGVRIAILVINSWGDHFVCDQELFTSPDVHLINFMNTQSYIFNLYPNTVQPKKTL